MSTSALYQAEYHSGLLHANIVPVKVKAVVCMAVAVMPTSRLLYEGSCLCMKGLVRPDRKLFVEWK